MDLHDVVKKLVGPIEPIGETQTDDNRLANLKEMIELIDKLLFDVSEVSRYNKKGVEHSMKVAGVYAHEFLTELKDTDVD